MSPLPSPSPLRNAILRTVFSPMGLFFGFVVLIMVMCPGARSDDAISLLLSNGGMESRRGLVDVDALEAVPSPAISRTIGRSTRSGRAPISSARSKTPSERAAESAALSQAPRQSRALPLQHSPSTLPILADPVTTDRAVDAPAAIVPMSGPAVGIRERASRYGR